jgi:hypothetical protein
MDEYLKANQQTWDAWTRHHLGPTLYDIEGFKAAGETLDPCLNSSTGRDSRLASACRVANHRLCRVPLRGVGGISMDGAWT